MVNITVNIMVVVMVNITGNIMVNIMVKLCYNMPLLMDRPMLLLPLALLLLPPACES